MLVGMATPTTPTAILAGNIAAARVRRRLQQSDLADRMRALGWKWVRQTVGEVENNNRRLTAEDRIRAGAHLNPRWDGAVARARLNDLRIPLAQAAVPRHPQPGWRARRQRGER